MTNIQLPGGEVVQGIRANKDLGYDGAPEQSFEAPPTEQVTAKSAELAWRRSSVILMKAAAA